MTDKQINYEQNSVIIDGCDVSGCECYSEHREGYCGWHTPCDGDTCPYKLKWALQQFKRKEQELEMICKTFDIEYIIDKETGSLIARSNKLQKKEQECDMWKNLTIDNGAVALKYQQQLDQLKKENEELKEYIKYLHNLCGNETDKQYEYKQTLDEIKVFIQKEIEYFDHDPEYQYDWKELMGLIKASEVDGESYLDNHWLFTENKKGES